MMESETVSSPPGDEGDSQRAVKRRARMALSCQRCRKHRSKCSRSKPSCEQCTVAGFSCTYLEVPGDLENTALRDRFQGLENQIHSLLDEFTSIERMVSCSEQPNDSNSDTDTTTTPSNIRINALQKWHINQTADSSNSGLSIDTHMFSVSDIYSTLIQFAKENSSAITLYPQVDTQKNKPIWLIRNHSIFPNVRLSHFTSLRPNVNDGEDSDEDPTQFQQPSSIDPEESTTLDEDDDIILPPELSPLLEKRLLDLYKTCLLYGAVQPFDSLFMNPLLDRKQHSPAFQLLYASIICLMLPHAYYWHPEIFLESLIDKPTCVNISVQYYKWAKRLLSSIYFDAPSLTTCHSICNLVLYHIENGNTPVIYIYSGMAVRMALSLQLYREDALDSISQHEADCFPPSYKPSTVVVKQYARSLLWFMYFLDTASSHYHNKPYEIHLDDHVSTTTFFKSPPTLPASNPQEEIVDEHQAFFQFIEFHTCQITRDIRRTIFTHPEEAQTSYEAIERIERRLSEFQKQLPPLEDLLNQNHYTMNLWHRRCIFKQWIRHHGHWILIHQSYLPTPMSVQRCTTAAFALVELFDHWIVRVDCYFRPCVHELKQACEILLYHVDQDTPIKVKALQGLLRLITVLLKTPVGEIARTRPFVQRVLKAIQQNKSVL